MSDRCIQSSDAARICVTSVGEGQIHLVAAPTGDHGTTVDVSAQAYRMVAGILSDGGLEIVHERVFAESAALPALLEARREALAAAGIAPDTPVTCVDGCPPGEGGFTGVQLRAVQADDVWTIRDGREPCGRGWKRSDTTFLMLHSMHGLAAGEPVDVSSADQVRRMFERTDRILKTQGADYRNVVRTWIYISDILAWYDEFNAVRNAVYGDFGLMPNGDGERLLLPASTGILGTGPLGGACLMDALAVLPGPDGVSIRQMTNVRQQDAFQYGSAFSRGVCIQGDGPMQLSISGTAAIDEQGHSVFPGDARAQIVATLNAVEALLAQEGATLQDVSIATLFLKRPDDLPALRQVLAERGLADLPATVAVADICRDELLFEMDADAVTA